ncbi:MAG: hypothetical protein WDN69_17950 [Aliidongia sp.]
MWAGGSFVFHQPLRLGERIRRVSTIKAVARKTGKQGKLVLRHGRPRDCRRDRRRSERGAHHRLSLGRRARCDGRGPASAGGPRLAAARDAGSHSAVPLLGADLQRPPHPLRPGLLHRGGRLSGAGRARAAAGDAAARTGPRGGACPTGTAVRLSRAGADLRYRPVHRERPARG